MVPSGIIFLWSGEVPLAYTFLTYVPSLLVMDYLIFHLSENAFISLSFLFSLDTEF